MAKRKRSATTQNNLLLSYYKQSSTSIGRQLRNVIKEKKNMDILELCSAKKGLESHICV
jgi:hypothetical protein